MIETLQVINDKLNTLIALTNSDNNVDLQVRQDLFEDIAREINVFQVESLRDPIDMQLSVATDLTNSEKLYQKINYLESEYEQLYQFFNQLTDKFEDHYETVTKNKMWGQPLGLHYQAFMVAIAEKLGLYEESIQTLQQQYDKESHDDNTITVYYLSHSPPGSKKLLGFDATGHLAIAARGKINGKTEMEYLSFYAVRKPAPSVLGRIFKSNSMPAPDSTEGRFGTGLSEDKKRFETGHITSVVIKCDRQPTLNFKKIIDQIKVRKSQENPEYNFYTNNCATEVLNVLKEGGCGRYITMPVTIGKFVAMPGDAFTYIQELAQYIERRQLVESLADVKSHRARVLECFKNIRLQFIKASIDFEKTSTKYPGSVVNEIRKIFQHIIYNIIDKAIHAIKDENNTDLNKLLDDIYSMLAQYIQFNHKDVSIQELIEATMRKIITPIQYIFPNHMQGIGRGYLVVLQRGIDGIALVSKSKNNNNNNDLNAKAATFMKDKCAQISKEYEDNINAHPRKNLLKLSSNIKSLIQELKLKIDKDDEFKTPVAKKYLQELQTSLGDINEFLYFDTYINLDSNNNNNNLVNRLHYLLTGENINCNSVKDIINTAIRSINKEAKVGEELSKYLQQSGAVPYSESHAHIRQMLAAKKEKNVRNTTLHFKAQLINALQAFCHGQLTLHGFQDAINKISGYAPDSQTNEAVINFLKSFKMQSFYDDVSANQRSNKKLKDIMLYQYYDEENNKTVEANNPSDFSAAFSSPLSESKLRASGYCILDNALNTITTSLEYAIYANEFGFAAFKCAIIAGFGKDNPQNKPLREKYDQLSKLPQLALTTADRAFMDMYQGVAFITKVLNSKAGLSHVQLRLEHDHFRESCHIKCNAEFEQCPLYSEMNEFQLTLKSIVVTANYQNEELIHIIKEEYAALNTVFKSFYDKLQNTVIAERLVEWVKFKSDMPGSDAALLKAWMQNLSPNSDFSQFNLTDGELLSLIMQESFAPLNVFWSDQKKMPKLQKMNAASTLLDYQNQYAVIVEKLQTRELTHDLFRSIGKELNDCLVSLATLKGNVTKSVDYSDREKQAMIAIIDDTFKHFNAANKVINKQFQQKNENDNDSIVGNYKRSPKG